MRLLYVGSLSLGSTSLDRLRILENLGFEALPVDTNRYVRLVTRLERSLMGRINVGRGVLKLNSDLIELTGREKYDLVWIDKGVWIYPETVDVLRQSSQRALAIHYTPDAQLLDNMSRHFINAIPFYDLLVTTKPFELRAYGAAGAQDTLLVLQGYGQNFQPSANSDVAGDPEFSSEVCFVGHSQAHYAHCLKAVAATGCVLKVWGPRWPRYARLHWWARAVVKGNGLWGERYPQALRSTKIALCLLNKRIPETTTTRTFEIPATGVFMLGERNDDHQALFTEGKEAEFFADHEELSDKVRFYLTHEDARARIAAAGFERCVRSKYSAENQIRLILEHVQGRLGVKLI